MEIVLQNCRARFILGLIASILLSFSASSARAATTVDPMSFPASTNGSVQIVGTHADSGCTGKVVATEGFATVVVTRSACVTDPENGKAATRILFIPGHASGAMPYGIWTVDSTAVQGEIAFLVLHPRKGWSLKQLTGASGLNFATSSAQDFVYFSTAQEPTSTSLLVPSAGSLFELVGGNPAGAEPLPAPALASKLLVHTKVRGSWTVISFGIGPVYPIAVHFTCRVGEKSASCRGPMPVPAGTMMTIEASYGVSGHRHFIGLHTVAVPR